MKLAALLVLSAILAAPALAAGNPSKPSKAGCDTLVAWLDLSYDRVKAEAIAPPQAARLYGLLGVTAWEAVAPGAKKTHRSLAGQLAGLPAGALPKPKSGLHYPAVLNHALHGVAVALLADLPDSVAACDALRDQLDAAAGIKAKNLKRSREQGEAVAAALLPWIAGDGSADAATGCAYVVPAPGGGAWEPTPPGFVADPTLPCWGQVRTLVLEDSSECAPPGPPPYSTSEISLFYAQALEVYAVVAQADPEQLAIARYWADGASATGTPPGHWVDLVRQQCLALELSLLDGCAAFARVGLAVHDAFIACWQVKYEHELLRPVTYIRDADKGAIDAQWLPPITTPPFPEYPSGHSTQSGAAVVALEEAFGHDFAFTDTTHEDQDPGLLLGTRSFASFDAAGREAAVSRLYGGIHFRAACDDGYEQGLCIGARVRDAVELRKGEDG